MNKLNQIMDGVYRGAVKAYHTLAAGISSIDSSLNLRSAEGASWSGRFNEAEQLLKEADKGISSQFTHGVYLAMIEKSAQRAKQNNTSFVKEYSAWQRDLKRE